VIVQRDGTRNEIDMPDMDAIRASMPEIRDGKCGRSDGKPMVEHRDEAGKKITIVCVDRIEMASADAERLALRHKVMGMESARMGLRIARQSIENEEHMTPDERAKALKGIDEAMAELESKRGD
jgi:bla regulator protein BlaR1